jgi:hypothetical protein
MNQPTQSLPTLTVKFIEIQWLYVIELQIKASFAK